MKECSESHEKKFPVARWLRAASLGLALVMLIASMASHGRLAQMTAGVQEAHALAVVYWQSGEWRADLRTYVACAEYLFFPETDAGARLDFDLEE